MFAIPHAQPLRGRPKVRDFNECITCPLCGGYLVNATTINDCMHSYCRSCIVQHLTANTHCPTCVKVRSASSASSKTIRISDIRRDFQLNAVVNKLVAGLRQSELQRRQAFNHTEDVQVSALLSPVKTASHAEHSMDTRSSTSSSNNNNNSHHIAPSVANRCNDDDVAADIGHLSADDDDDGEFFAPDDPISLALEYHPTAVLHHAADEVPAPKYLQCPAAVSVQHLQRFLASKFCLNYAACTSGIDIQIITADEAAEVLPAKFTLMDVAYCTRWQRLAPLKLYYQILVSSSAAEQPTPIDSPQDNGSPSSLCTTQAECSPVSAASSRHLSAERTSSSDSKYTTLGTVHEDSASGSYFDADDDDEREPEIDMYSISIDKPTKPTKVTLVKNYAKAAAGPPTTAAHTNHHHHPTSSSSKSSTTPTSTAAKSKYSSAKPGSTPTMPKSSHKLSDFKSLRSNDIKYSPPTSSSSRTTTTAKTTKTSMSTDVCAAAAADVPHQPSDKYANKPTQAAQVKRSMVSASARSPSSSPTPATTCVGNRCDINDIFTTMKRQHENEMRELQQERRKRSMASNDNATPARPPMSTFTPPPSPSIVVSIPPIARRGRRNSISEEHYESMSLAKLKTANKKSARTAPYKHSISVDDIVMRRLTSGSGNSNSSTSTNTAAASSAGRHVEAIPKLKIELATLTRTNVPELETDPASPAELRAAHKKRKKLAKQASLGGKTSKRPKLHAEISSQADESLKVRLKITGNKKTSSTSSGSKHERKVSSTSNDSSCSSSTGSSEPVAQPLQDEDTLTGAAMSKLVLDELKKLEDVVSPEPADNISETIVVDEPSEISVDQSDTPEVEPSKSEDVAKQTTNAFDEMPIIVIPATEDPFFADDFDDVIITNVSYLPLTPPETNNNDMSSELAPAEATKSVQFIKPKPVPELRPKSTLSPIKFLPAMRLNMMHSNNNNELERLPEILSITTVSTPTASNGATQPEPSTSSVSSNQNNTSDALEAQPSNRPVAFGSASDTGNSDDNSQPPKRSKYSIEYRTISLEPQPPSPKKIPNLIRKSPPNKRQPMPLPMPMKTFLARPSPDRSFQLSGHEMLTFPNRPAVEIVRVPTGSNSTVRTQSPKMVRPQPMPGKFKPNNFASNVFHMSTQLPPNTTVPSLVRSSRPMPPTISLSKIRNMHRNASPTRSTAASSSASSSSTLMLPPLVKTSHKRCDTSGALDLSGCKSPPIEIWPIKSIHSIKGRSAAHLQPPVAYIDITSPTKADKVEPVRPTPKLLAPKPAPMPPFRPFVLSISPTFSYAPIETGNSTNGIATLSPITSGMSIAHILNAQDASKSSTLDELTRHCDEQQRLANLKLLSESAVGCEKLDITRSAGTTSSSAASTTSSSSSSSSSIASPPKSAAAYLTPKPTPTSSASIITANTTAVRTTNMRQQNASVRNIPNPSALAFRGYEPLSSQARPTPATSSPSPSSSLSTYTHPSSGSAFAGMPPPPAPAQLSAFSTVPSTINHSIKMLTTTLSTVTQPTPTSPTSVPVARLALLSMIPPMPPLIPHAQFGAARSAAVRTPSADPTTPVSVFNVATSNSCGGSTGGAVPLTVSNGSNGSASIQTTSAAPWLAAVHSTVTTSSSSSSSSSPAPTAAVATASVTMASSSSSATPAPPKNFAQQQQQLYFSSSSSETGTHPANAAVQLIAAKTAASSSVPTTRTAATERGTPSSLLDSASTRSTPLSA